MKKAQNVVQKILSAHLVEGDPAKDGWGWAIDKGATVIQTDNPRPLLKWLESVGRR